MKRKSSAKKSFDWNSASTKKDLATFFKEKFPSKTLKEIKEEINESLSDSSGRYSDEGGASVTVDGEEFNLIENQDKFRDVALKYVKDMLDNEPESFNQSFIQNHVYITDTDRGIIADEEATARYEDMRDREIEEEYYRKHKELILEDDHDEDSDPDYDAMRESLSSDYAEDIEESLKDPIGYFVDEQGIYTIEELLNSSFIRIDTDEAAEAAVDEDGEAHFLSHYDGNYEETDGGIIVMKE